MFLWVQKRLKSVDSFPCHVFSVMFLKSPCEHAGSQMWHLGTGSWGGGVYVCVGVVLAMGGGASQTPCLSFPAQQHSGGTCTSVDPHRQRQRQGPTLSVGDGCARGPAGTPSWLAPGHRTCACLDHLKAVRRVETCGLWR